MWNQDKPSRHTTKIRRKINTQKEKEIGTVAPKFTVLQTRTTVTIVAADI